MYKIEDNIPLTNKTSVSNYPFSTMEVGQSFFAETSLKECHCIRTAIGKFKLLNPSLKFATRTVTNNEDKLIGIRVWRIR